MFVYGLDNLDNKILNVIKDNASQNCLRRAGLMTIGDLCTRIHSSAELKQLRNCGTTSVEEILDHLFVYQYNVLSPERRKDFVARVVELNLLQ